MSSIPSFPDQIRDYCSNDPFGNFVVVPPNVLNLDRKLIKMDLNYEDALEAISDPVFILDMIDEEVSFYYFRKILGEDSILIGAKKAEDHFEVCICQINPTAAQLSILFKKAKQIH
jgi:hypothetical protein